MHSSNAPFGGARRVFSARPSSGYHPGRSRSAANNEVLANRPTPGLTERERISGRPVSARRQHPGGRYFTLDYTPRAYQRRPAAVSV